MYCRLVVTSTLYHRMTRTGRAGGLKGELSSSVLRTTHLRHNLIIVELLL